MIKGQDKILQWFEYNKCPHWKLRQGSGSTKVIAMSEGLINSESDDDEEKSNRRTPANNLSMDASRSQLMEVLEMISPGRYTLSVSRTGLGGKSWLEELIDTSDGKAVGAIQTGAPTVGSGFVSKTDVQALIEKELTSYKQQLRIEELERQNAELKKGDAGDPWVRGLDLIDKHLGPYAGQLLGAKPIAQVAVSGFTKDAKTKTDATEADQERFEKALEILNEKTPDLVAAFERLAAIAQTNPTQYNMLLGMLNTQ